MSWRGMGGLGLLSDDWRYEEGFLGGGVWRIEDVGYELCGWEYKGHFGCYGLIGKHGRITGKYLMFLISSKL